MNNKILSLVLVAWIASTWFAGISAANSDLTLSGTLESIESGVKNMTQWWEKFWKRKGGGNLTDDEKLALESMNDEEKKEFFDAKKAEMKAQKEARKDLIDALITGESLTTDQETLRIEMLEKIGDTDSKFGKRDNAEVIAKLLNGEVLSADDQVIIAEMQEKQAEREAQRALLEPIKAKLDAGEELTDEEQSLLDEAKSQRKGKKGHGKRGDRGEK